MAQEVSVLRRENAVDAYPDVRLDTSSLISHNEYSASRAVGPLESVGIIRAPARCEPVCAEVKPRLKQLAAQRQSGRSIGLPDFLP